MTAKCPAVFGISGQALTVDEISFLKDANPVGIILFARNVDTPDQVKRLNDQIKNILGSEAHILVDQEGGRVQRLTPPHWAQFPAAETFGPVWQENPAKAAEDVKKHYELIGNDLAALGFTVDCAPVLDLRFDWAHDVIGERSFSEDPACVADLGRAACEGLLAAGITPVIKHIPGHGRALVDSHHDLPEVDASKEELAQTDFAPFKDFAKSEVAHHVWAMTAHVVYKDIDPDHPATCSSRMIQTVIRKEIGFSGLLIADDLDMKALRGSYREKLERCFAAGCDLILQCDGDLSKMQEVAGASPAFSSAKLNLLKSAA